MTVVEAGPMDERAHPIVDFDVVEAQTLGDAAFERRLLEAFLDDNEERLRVARAALERGAGEDLGLEAHSLKGAASTLGALPLADAARALESAAAEGRFEDARRCFESVAQELARVRGVLLERLGTSEAK